MLTKSQEVLQGSAVPVEDHAIVGLHANLLINTRGGIPSWNMKCAVDEYLRLGRHAFILQGRRENINAMRTCGCIPCKNDADRLEGLVQA